MSTSSVNAGSVRRGFKRGVRQIVRDRSWGATLLTLSGIMLLVQTLFMFLLSVNGAGSLLTANAGIRMEVLPSAREQDIQALYAELSSHPSVQNAEYVTGQQAYERQKARDPELISFFEEYDLENPFPDAFAVTLTSLDSYDSFAALMRDERWRGVVDPSFLSAGTGEQEEVRTLLRVTGALRTLGIALIAVAVIALFFTILEWISRVAMRRNQELLLEHLIGAPPLAIIMPLACEMALLLAGATIIATILCFALLSLLPILMPAFTFEPVFRMLQSNMMPILLAALPALLAIELLVMPLLSFAGAAIGVRRRMPASFTLLS